ncbi:MAG TPA: serine/threonine-protein kinase [Gaiellaceae bacterium]
MPDNLIAGRYRLDELLGRSGMSEVWAATDTELGRRVALKLLAPNADSARFEREARAVASLGHPNITQLYDYGEEDGRPYMVLEYLPGGTLEERLGTGRPLPDEDTRRISAELAAGLAHAHARDVVHRDLKPANVLFDQEGRAKLADFGIARMAAGEGTLTEAGTVLGTAAYISPEQAAGAPASAASDVYSFGVMLYRMLTGRLPFESNNPMELVALHRDSDPPPLTQFRDDAPALLESTVNAALAKDPDDRPADGAALLAALGVPAGFSSITTSTGGGFIDPDATSVLPLAAASARTAARPAGPPRRSRTPLAVAALLVLVLAGAALAYEVTRPASGPTPDTVPITAPKPTTQTHTQPTTTVATTTASTTQSTQQTTTLTATLAPPPTTTTTPPTTTPPTTTPPPTTTTAPPATTTAVPPPTTTASPATTGP